MNEIRIERVNNGFIAYFEKSNSGYRESPDVIEPVVATNEIELIEQLRKMLPQMKTQREIEDFINRENPNNNNNNERRVNGLGALFG